MDIKWAESEPGNKERVPSSGLYMYFPSFSCLLVPVVLAFYQFLVTILKLSLEQLPGCHCLSVPAYLVWKASMIIGVSNSRSFLCKLCVPLPMCWCLKAMVYPGFSCGFQTTVLMVDVLSWYMLWTNNSKKGNYSAFFSTKLLRNYSAFFSTKLLRNYPAFSCTELLRNYPAFSCTKVVRYYPAFSCTKVVRFYPAFSCTKVVRCYPAFSCTKVVRCYPAFPCTKVVRCYPAFPCTKVVPYYPAFSCTKVLRCYPAFFCTKVVL